MGKPCKALLILRVPASSIVEYLSETRALIMFSRTADPATEADQKHE